MVLTQKSLTQVPMGAGNITYRRKEDRHKRSISSHSTLAIITGCQPRCGTSTEGCGGGGELEASALKKRAVTA